MTIDADLARRGRRLRKTYLGTDNYLMGKRIGEYVKKQAEWRHRLHHPGQPRRRQHPAPRPGHA